MWQRSNLKGNLNHFGPSQFQSLPPPLTFLNRLLSLKIIFCLLVSCETEVEQNREEIEQKEIRTWVFHELEKIIKPPFLGRRRDHLQRSYYEYHPLPYSIENQL